MSQLGQSRHFDRAPLASGLPRLADITILADGNTISQATAGRARCVTPKVKEERLKCAHISF